LFHPKSITNIDAMTEKQKTIYLVIEAYWNDFIKELVQENEDRKDRLGIKASNPPPSTPSI
jgi:hypothetical protein